MDMDSNPRIEELAREKLGGKSYSEIREELKSEGMAAGEISQLIRQVDEKVLKETLEQGSRQKTQQWYRWGLVMAVVGLILSIGYNAGIILSRFPALLVYSPFLAGILLMFYGRMQQRKKPDSADGPGPIRKKRPYK